MPVTFLNENQRPMILVVDDTPENLSIMGELLNDDYKVKIANSGRKALTIARTHPQPDIILLDINMPEMDGYEVCRQLKETPQTAEIPIIFLTARTDIEDEKRGFQLGAVDYITKPISPPILMARIKTHLHLKSVADFIRDKNIFLEKEVSRRTREVYAIQDIAILALASLAETRDNETGNHLRRTQIYIRMLAEALKDNPHFKNYLTDDNITILFKSAPLHDIGKVGIPDNILLKPARLTPDEFNIMKRHTIIGRDAIEHAESSLGTHMEFLKTAKEIALYHHEKWDGTGYPEGLSGENIPISARLMAVADVYDALISRRVYHDPTPHEDVIKILTEGRGTHFDPEILDVFLRIQQDFKKVAEQYTDPDTRLTPKEAS
ncbi:MAG TPA: two-component system response regulator [Rhodospirillaceae bacterium]|nr:MAG: two-component system response regulator [Alphaproteobacteria bacterium GWF2_58_20]HAU28876.1 two-component system response regulator [Rhodospirillaceae bacterium]